MTNVDTAAAACRALLDASMARDKAIERRDAALRAMATEDGIPRSQVGAKLRERLAAEFTEAQIAVMGVSDANVRGAFPRGR